MLQLAAASPGARELHFPRVDQRGTVVISTEPNPRVTGISEDDEVIHVVGFFEHWLDVLRLKIPRALCGVSLEGDPDRPSPGFNAPVCRRCAEIEGQ